MAGVLFYFSTRPDHVHFDYTFRVAQALLRGHTGLNHHPGSWLNEFIPLAGKFYSVFPLGAVLANIPVPLLYNMGLVHEGPAGIFAPLNAAFRVYFPAVCTHGR